MLLLLLFEISEQLLGRLCKEVCWLWYSMSTDVVLTLVHVVLSHGVHRADGFVMIALLLLGEHLMLRLLLRLWREGD